MLKIVRADEHPVVAAETEEHSVVTATMRVVEQAGLRGSVLGEQALLIARLMLDETKGAPAAALSRQLSRLVAQIEARVEKADEVAEARSARDRKRAEAAAMAHRT